MSIDVMTLAVSKDYTDKQIEKASIKGADLSGYVQSVNGVKPDKNGNVEILIPTDEHINTMIDNKMSANQWILTDENTGKKYKLAVIDGKLTMTEVE